MAKEFIYFFKHENQAAIKIGKTSGDSVLSRFNQFKVYSPHGATIIGFFEIENAFEVERELHRKYEAFRLHGEWFNIPEEMVYAIISKYNDSYIVAKKMFNEWIADQNNNVKKLAEILAMANDKAYLIEDDVVSKYVLPGQKRLTSFEILEHIKNYEPGVDLTIGKVARLLTKAGYKRIIFRRDNKPTRGFNVTLKPMT